MRKKLRIKVSIIITNLDAALVTLKALKAIKQYTPYPYEIILLDNASYDQEFERLKKGIIRLHLPITVKRNPQNYGFSIANNQGAKLALGDILVFLNNDVIVTQGWLTPLLQALRKDKNVAVCQPKLRSYLHREYFDYTGGAGGYIDMFGYPFTRGRIFDHIEKDQGQYDTIAEITWGSGSCFVIYKHLFDAMGGFDEYIFAYHEEIDLCIRLRKKGYTILCVPQSVVYHYGAYTSNKDLVRKTFLNHHNSLYILLKHSSLIPDFPLFVSRFLFDLLAVVYYLKQGNIRFIRSVLTAHVMLIKNIPLFLQNRIISLTGRHLREVPTVYQSSVVISYFLQNIKNYRNLMSGLPESVSTYKRYKDVTYFA